MIVGQLIQVWREKQGLTIRQLASQMEVNHSALWRFEQGHDVSQSQWVQIVKWAMTYDPKQQQPKECKCRKTKQS